MTLSEQGTYAAFAEYDGPLHVYTSQDISDPAVLGLGADGDGVPRLEPFSGHRAVVDVEWPGMPEPVPGIAWTEQTWVVVDYVWDGAENENSPLNVIGMPLYTEKLTSNLAPQVYMTQSSPLVRPPPKIPREVLATVRMVDGIGYAPLPREMRGRRNVVCARADANFLPQLRDAVGARPGDAMRRESGPRFRSERERHQRAATDEVSGLNPTPKARLMLVTQLAGTGENGISAAHMPKYYRKVEIKYSRFGVEVGTTTAT